MKQTPPQRVISYCSDFGCSFSKAYFNPFIEEGGYKYCDSVCNDTYPYHANTNR